MKNVSTPLHLLSCAFLLLTVIACSGPTAQEPTADQQPTAAPAAEPSPPAADHGNLAFTVDAGPHTGSYGGPLSEDSTFTLRPMGDQSMMVLRMIHEREDGTTDSFSANLAVPQTFTGGELDLAGSLANTGHLPDGVSQDERFFSLNAAGGSGTLTIEAMDAEAGTIRGTYRIAQDGTTAEGSFHLEK